MEERATTVYFRQNLKFLRKRAGLNIAELGKWLGVSRATVGNYENGSTEPSHDTIIKISEYFTVSLDDLFSKDLSKYSSSMKLLTPTNTKEKQDGKSNGQVRTISENEYSKMIDLINIQKEMIENLKKQSKK